MKNVGSIFDVSDNGIEHISYYYHYRGYSGGAKLDDILDYTLKFEFDEISGTLKPDFTKSKRITDIYKHYLLLKEDVFTDAEL